MNFSEIFYYDLTSPTGLRWKIWNGQKNHSERDIHDFAGSKGKGNNDSEFYRVGYQNKEYKVHRIIWILHNGSIPDDIVVDHIDGNPLNNDISNLRIVTQEINCKNSSKRSDNKTGVCGVTISKIREFTYYRAYCKVDGKQKSRSFSIENYGEELAFKLACEWRKSQIEKLNQLGAGYTERHGT